MKKEKKNTPSPADARVNPSDTSVVVSSADGTLIEVQIPKAEENVPPLAPGGVGLDAAFLVPSTDMCIFPWGADNMMPLNLFNLLREDNLSRPILKKVRGLFWGRGPHVEYGSLSEEKRLRLRGFVDKMGFTRFMLRLYTDYFHTACAAAFVVRQRDGKALATLRHIPVWQVRLAKRQDDPYLDPTHAVVGDFSGMPMPAKTQVFPLFDPARPLAHPMSVCFFSEPDYFANPYPLPDYAGGQEWIRRSIEAPRVLGSFVENSMSIRWIVRIPAKYWQDMYAQIEKEMAEKNKGKVNKTDVQKTFDTLKSGKLNNMMALLAGAKNVGKVFISDVIVEVFGNSFYEYKWEIEQVELKIKDYVESVIAISNAADAKKTGAFSLHASLANVGQTGRADSGSEQLYAYTNHLNSSVAIPEENICGPIGEILRFVAGAPDDEGVRIVFDRPEPVRQSDITASERITAQKIS